MRRAPAGAVLFVMLMIGSVAAQGDDKPKMIKLDGLSPSLLSKLVGRYLDRDYKGNKDKEKVVEALAPLGGLDKVAENLNYQFKDGKPRFVVNASSTPRPAGAAAVETALQDVLEHTFTQLTKQPEQVGEDRYAIDKAEADKVKAEFPTALRVIWKPEPKEPDPVPVPIDPPAKPAPPAPPPPRRPAPAASGGRWKLVVSGTGVDCCGRAVPTYRWSFQGANGNGSAPADGVPVPANGPLSVTGLRATDAPRLFWRGYGLYWQGEHEAAWRQFDAAARLADDDARYWYFKALTELALGRDDDAQKSRQRGAELQAIARPSAELVGRALERVQGPRRMWLREGLDNLTARPPQ